MKKTKYVLPLGRRQMEAAGSLTPDLEGVSKSYRHQNRGFPGQSAPDFGQTGRLAKSNRKKFPSVSGGMGNGVRGPDGE